MRLERRLNPPFRKERACLLLQSSYTLSITGVHDTDDLSTFVPMFDVGLGRKDLA